MVDLDEVIEYAKFFDECLEGRIMSYRFKRFKNQILKIINHYNDIEAFEESTPSFERCYPVCFIRELLRVLYHVKETKAYDQLDTCIDVLLEKNINGNDFPACLSTLLFKNEKVLDYYEYTDTIVDLIAYFEDVDTTNLDSDVRLINLIKLYYRHKPVIIPDDYHSKAKSYDYDTYALNIIGEFYLTDLDIEYLDQLLLKSSTNDMHETLSIYYTRNGQDGESFKQKVLSHNPLAKKEIK